MQIRNKSRPEIDPCGTTEKNKKTKKMKGCLIPTLFL